MNRLFAANAAEEHGNSTNNFVEAATLQVKNKQNKKKRKKVFAGKSKNSIKYRRILAFSRIKK